MKLYSDHAEANSSPPERRNPLFLPVWLLWPATAEDTTLRCGGRNCRGDKGTGIIYTGDSRGRRRSKPAHNTEVPRVPRVGGSADQTNRVIYDECIWLGSGFPVWQEVSEADGMAEYSIGFGFWSSYTTSPWAKYSVPTDYSDSSRKPRPSTSDTP